MLTALATFLYSKYTQIMQAKILFQNFFLKLIFTKPNPYKCLLCAARAMSTDVGIFKNADFSFRRTQTAF